LIPGSKKFRKLLEGLNQINRGMDTNRHMREAGGTLDKEGMVPRKSFYYFQKIQCGGRVGATWVKERKKIQGASERWYEYCKGKKKKGEPTG